MSENAYLHIEHQNDPGTLCDAVFAIRLISCPAERSGPEDESAVASRRLAEQARLIGALSFGGMTSVFRLRFVTQPHATSFASSRLEVAILGKVSGPDEAQVRVAAQMQVTELGALLRGSMPDHVWQVVKDEKTFNSIWQPFDWEFAHVAEIRRREQRVKLGAASLRPTLGQHRAEESADSEDVYFVHPYAPRGTSLSQLLRTALLYPEPLLWQVTIAPAQLTESEIQEFHEQLMFCERYEYQDSSLAPDSIQHGRAAALSGAMLAQLMRMESAPYLMSVMVASPQPLPTAIVEAIALEVSAPVGEQAERGDVASQSGGHVVVFPADASQNDAARLAARAMTFRHWGETLAPTGLRRLRYLVDAAEAAGAFRLPLATKAGLPGLEVTASRVQPLPPEVAASAYTTASAPRMLIGENRYLGFTEPVFLTERDRRQHVYIVGQTGTGKTTLIKTMALADMVAGHGLAVIDPHGDLHAELLAQIPEERIQDVVVLDPTDMDFPVGLNLMECSSEENRHAIVREIKGIMERLLEDQYGAHAREMTGPLYYLHLQMNMLLAMSNPADPGTLVEFLEIFQSKKYWRRWLPLKVNDPRLLRWTETALPAHDYTSRGSDSAAFGSYISSKFEDFLFDPRLRLMFGQKRSTVNLREIMDCGKILLVNLAKGKLTEANARFLGMILMAKLQLAAMERVDTPIEQRRMFSIFVDEFQAIATQNFVLMLSEARKFGLNLVLANQFVSQIKNEKIMESIFGNVGTLVSFRVGQADAHILEPRFSPRFDEVDLTNLPNWQACVRTSVQGQVMPSFTMNTVPPVNVPSMAIAGRAVQQSREKYGCSRSEVEKTIARSLLPLREFSKQRPVTEIVKSAKIQAFLRERRIDTVGQLCARKIGELRSGLSCSDIQDLRQELRAYDCEFQQDEDKDASEDGKPNPPKDH